MNNTETLIEIIEQHINDLDIDRKPELLYSPIRYALGTGGKRMRPVLTLMSCELFDGQIDRAMNSALAIEIFHNFTLLHDDIMDNSDMRRGKPSVHKKWNDNVAILSGDAMMIYAYEILSKSSADKLPKLLNTFNRIAMEVCEGQQYDMDFESTDNVRIEDYIEMIRLKTSVLLAGALKMGAIAAGASEQDSELIYDFGVNIGLAFQLRDDILDTYGDPKVFGKNIGGDILCNKKTFMLLTALERAKQQNIDLKRVLEDKTISGEEKIASVIRIYDLLDIKNHAQQTAENYFRSALLALDKISVASENKTILRDYAASLMLREK